MCVTKHTVSAENSISDMYRLHGNIQSYDWRGLNIHAAYCSTRSFIMLNKICLTLTVPVTTIDALRHFETG